MNTSLQKALHFLATTQQDSGTFVSFSSSHTAPFAAEHTYQTVLAPALILDALNNVSVPQAEQIKSKIAAYLLRQKSEHWSFNYWDRGSKEAATMPYPDDLDDTFCALSSLWRYDKSSINEGALAHIVKLLIATEAEVGGPYRTWLAPRNSAEAWRDIDNAVNANVAYFLRLAIEPLPNLTAYMENAICAQTYTSPYYPTVYPVVYYLSRAYRGENSPALAAYILAQRQADGSWGSPLQTALAITSLSRLGHQTDESAAQYLARTQQTNGSWPAEAFCIDPTLNGKTFYSGSPALTTALVVEALHAAWHRSTKQIRAKTMQPAPLVKSVIQRATKECTQLEAPIRRPILAALKQAAAGKNGAEITMLAHRFYNDLQKPARLSPTVFENLALANLYGWTAYTMYDDILDGEASAALLPAANSAMRRSLVAFEQAVPTNPAFIAHVRTVFDRMDAANAWEAQHCRCSVAGTTLILDTLPEYRTRDRLAERSLGHALPVIGVLAACGLSPQSAAAQAIQAAMHHYLIARQLNDDMHDWQEDLRAGRLTYVVIHILRSLKITAGTYDFTELMSQADQQFWHHTLPQICRTVTLHIQKSRRALADSGLINSSHNTIDTLLAALDTAMAETFVALDQAEQFLAAYRSA